MARVLVIDDHFDTQLMLAKHLDVSGHTPILACNGWEALIALEHRPIDVILLDVMMPGMDGPAFLRVLQGSDRDRTIPVLVISALETADAAQRFGDFKIAQILPKTNQLFDNLMGAISSALSGAAVTASPI